MLTICNIFVNKLLTFRTLKTEVRRRMTEDERQKNNNLKQKLSDFSQKQRKMVIFVKKNDFYG